MNEVTSEIEADISPERAWEKLRDLSLAHNYVPGLTGAKITTDQHEGVGASRQVFSKNRPPLDETVVEWEEGHGFLLRLHHGDADAQGPFKRAFFHYTIVPAGSKTLLRNSMQYAMKWGLAGALLDKLVLRRIFKSVVNDVVIAQKSFYETGEPVDAAQLKKLKQ